MIPTINGLSISKVVGVNTFSSESDTRQACKDCCCDIHVLHWLQNQGVSTDSKFRNTLEYSHYMLYNASAQKRNLLKNHNSYILLSCKIGSLINYVVKNG